MANTHTTLTSLFSDIADAIRTKTGGIDTIVADNFPNFINELNMCYIGGETPPSDLGEDGDIYIVKVVL